MGKEREKWRKKMKKKKRRVFVKMSQRERFWHLLSNEFTIMRHRRLVNIVNTHNTQSHTTIIKDTLHIHIQPQSTTNHYCDTITFLPLSLPSFTISFSIFFLFFFFISFDGHEFGGLNCKSQKFASRTKHTTRFAWQAPRVINFVQKKNSLFLSLFFGL